MKRLRQFERILISVAVILAGLAGIYGIYRMIVFGDAFAIERIIVKGDWKYLSADRIASLSGIKKDDNLFWISVDEVHRRLRADPWVRTTAVQRKIPNAVWIYAAEHKPVAIVASKGLYYIDDLGEIFKAIGPGEDRSFPVLTGLSVGNNFSLSPEDGERTLNMLHIIDVFGKSEFGKKQDIAEVHYDDSYGYSMITKDGPMQIFLGHAAFDEKIAQIGRMISAVSERGGRITYMMASEPGRLIVKYHLS